MTRFLIAGLGSVGRRHLRNLQALGESDIILLRSGKATLPEEQLAGLPVERDIAAALQRWNPDAVIVSNPTALHLDVAIPASRAGCHLMIEKPVSHSMQRIDELRRAMREGGSRALVGFQFRFHPGLREARRLLNAGAIGKPVHVGVHWGEYLPDWHPWEDYHGSYAARADLGGGVILTHCHPFDYLRWLLGEVAHVSAVAGTLGGFGLDVEDCVEVTLAFASGALGSVHLDYIQRPPSHRLEIVGTRGTIRWDNADGAVRWWAAEAGASTEIPAPEGFERNTMFLDEMRHFLDVARGGADPLISLEDGVKALEIALRALASAKGHPVPATAPRDGQ
jgi:predicted dehydrogenase